MSTGGNAARRFVFTWFNWTEDERTRLTHWIETNDCLYAIFGKEKCPTTNNPHLQGFLHIKTKKRISTLAGVLGVLGDNRVTIALARGSDEENRIYCGKGDDVYIHGTPRVNGRATELDDAIALLGTDGMEAVAIQYPKTFVRNHRGLAALSALGKRQRTEKPITIWLWGESGAGKTYMARRLQREKDMTFYRKSFTTKLWWPGYDQQQILLIDDVRCVVDGVGRTFMHMLDWLDEYETSVEIKGLNMPLNSKVIFVTSILPPETEYAGEKEQLVQLIRRIDHCKEVTEDNREEIFSFILTLL